MNEGLEFVTRAVAVGVGATLVMDLWAVILKRLEVRSLDYGLLGRWLGHLCRGRLAHPNIGQATAIRGERGVGWAAHYGIGVGFAGLLLGVWGIGWARAPTVGPAMLVGMVTLVAPFFVLQPALGLGVLARNAPDPGQARLKSALAHAAYGLGLYVAAQGWAWLLPGPWFPH